MDSISDKVKKIRVEYEDKPLNLEDLNQDPLEQFNTWFQIAIDAEVNEANAMAISTISQEGTPRSRYVLFKDIVDNKLVFTPIIKAVRVERWIIIQIFLGYSFGLNSIAK